MANEIEQQDQTQEPMAAAVEQVAGGSVDMMMDPEAFAQGQRVAKMLASSRLVPQHMQGQTADCFLALHMARRLGEDPLMVCQNIVIIQGTAGWKAQWLISRANRLGVFRGRIRFDEHGQGDSLGVTARAELAETGEEVSASADMAMAKAEGWTKNPKYQSMPKQMLSYRAASFLIRLYCPEATLGYQSAEELEDVAATQPAQRQRPTEATTSAAETVASLAPAQGDAQPAQQASDDEAEHMDREATGGCDVAGVPYDSRIHSARCTVTTDGYWRRKRGVTPEYYRQVLAEIAPQALENEPPEAVNSADEQPSGEADAPTQGSAEDPPF